MLDVLEIFERLSSESKLDQQEMAEEFKLFPVLIQKAFKNQNSEIIRSACSATRLFSDELGLFSLN